MKDQVTQHASHFKGRGLLTFIKIPVIFFAVNLNVKSLYHFFLQNKRSRKY